MSRKIRYATLILLLVVMACSNGALPLSPGGQPPRVIAPGDHLVVLQYEAWFGPKAVNFQDAEAMPILQSKDMIPYGGGYDSASPAVIRQHIAWMDYMGIDAAAIDMTNNIGCIFSEGPVSRRYCNPASEAFRASNRAILANNANLYPAWTKLHAKLKLIPILGCQTRLDVNLDPQGKTGFQKAIEYFGRLQAAYPGLSVVYKGRPMMMVYLGTPVDLSLYHKCKNVIATNALAQRYTFRFSSGYMDSQWPLWKDPSQTPNGPIEISPKYDFWSWVDRYKPAYHLWPTYNLVPGTNQTENFTASIAVAGTKGWGCPQPRRYCPDDSLRWGSNGSTYVTLHKFMVLAAKLRPTFLFIHQFNEFTMADEGWDAQTSDDSEPTQLPKGWAHTAIDAIHTEIAAYRRALSL